MSPRDFILLNSADHVHLEVYSYVPQIMLWLFKEYFLGSSSYPVG